MKKVKVIVAAIAVLFAITTSAFTKLSQSVKLEDYFVSALQEPSQTSEFDSNQTLDITFVKNNFCPGANNVDCRYMWLASHVTVDGSGQPTGIAIDPATSLPYAPDAIVKKP